MLRINALQNEIGQERRRAQEIEDMEYQPLTKPEDMLDSGPTWSYVSRLQEKINRVEAEIEAIEKVLSKRHQ